MKTMYLIFFLLSIIYCPQSVYGQIIKKPIKSKPFEFKMQPGISQGYTAITVSKNDRSRDIIPAKEAERFKFRFPIEIDTAFFMLRAEKLKYGEHLEDRFYNDRIVYRPYLKKGDIVFFEMIPDISLGNKLTLFSNFPRMTDFHFMKCPDNMRFKYKLFEKSTNKQIDVGALILIYMDDKNNNIEKKVEKYCKNNLIVNSPKKYSKLLKEIELCMLVHYRIDNDPSVLE